MEADGSIGADVKRFEASLNKIRRMAERFGTKADSKENRTQLERERDTAKQLAHSITAAMKRAPRPEVKQYGGTFQSLLQQFQRLTENIDSKEKAVVKKAEAASASQRDGPSPLQQSGSVGQIQGGDESIDVKNIEFLEYDVNELDQRRAEIAAIEKDVRELASMFADVAMMVNQQQEGIDTMEQNIQNAKQKTQEGEKELQKAEEYQNSARKKQCILLMLVLIVLTIIIVPTVVVTSKK